MSAVASRWPLVVPPVGALLLGAAFLFPLHPALALACALGLFACVTAAVHHAEVVAHRVGEPYGTLVLALAISAIEVALVLSLTLAGGPAKAALARDTVFATVMIICNGVIGLCILLGAWRHREQTFRIEGFGPAYAAVVAAAVLFHVPLVLGLEPKDLVLLAVTFVVGAIATGSGRTNLMQGAVQLVLFAAFLFLAVVP